MTGKEKKRKAAGSKKHVEHARNVQALSGKRTRRRLLATSLKAKRLVERNRGTLLNSYRLIRDHFKELEKGKHVEAEGISIERAATGKFKGKKNIFTLLVKTREFEFFVKVFEPRAEVDIIRGLNVLEHHLRQTHYKVEGVNMVSIKPLLLYEDLVGKRSFLVTRFLKESEVEQVSNMKKSNKKSKISKALLRLRLKMDALHDVWEVADVNAFYHRETDTVYLFDIYHFKP